MRSCARLSEIAGRSGLAALTGVGSGEILSLISGLTLGLILSLILSMSGGCASHPLQMSSARALMAGQDYSAALGEVDKICKGNDDVLCLLEKGLLLHYVGEYDSSNKVFDRAEVRTEELYGKSVSREAASLVTSNLVLQYVPRPYEQVLINYFRALNYVFLGDQEGALVECRKASEKLARYADAGKRPYRQDAFMEYLTGILYEWGGETNDALVSYKNAVDAYKAYRDLLGVPAPTELACDMLRTAESLGFASDAEAVPADDRARCAGDSLVEADSSARVVVIVEAGFVPAEREASINIPILKSEAHHAHDDPYDFSLGIESRMYGNSFSADEIDYFLRIAMPYYADVPPSHPSPAFYLDSLEYVPAECEDVYAIARQELKSDMPGIFAKTLARAIVKYELSSKAEGKYGRLMGTLVNAAGAATEQADLRSWLSLPRAIYLETVYVAPGPHTITLAARTGQSVQVTTEPGTINFVRFRLY